MTSICVAVSSMLGRSDHGEAIWYEKVVGSTLPSRRIGRLMGEIASEAYVRSAGGCLDGGGSRSRPERFTALKPGCWRCRDDVGRAAGRCGFRRKMFRSDRRAMWQRRRRRALAGVRCGRHRREMWTPPGDDLPLPEGDAESAGGRCADTGRRCGRNGDGVAKHGLRNTR